MNQTEIQRITDILMLMTDAEIRSFLYRMPSRKFSQYYSAKNIDPSARYRYQRVNKVISYIRKGPECDGCGGISKSGKTLRWKKVSEGQPVTWSIDNTGRPDSLKHLTTDYIKKHWFDPWDAVCGITHKYVEGKGDIHIGYRALPGSTLGFAWQPANNAEFMEQGGDLSGDLFIDSDREWDKDTADGTGCHEVGHADGHAHINNRLALLYPYSNGQTVPQRLDIDAALIKYPNNSKLAA